MFPENLQDREKYIEDHVISGDFDAKWTELIHESGGRRLKLNVMDDALKIDGVRVNVSAKLSQRLADLFDASLPTPLVADLMYRHAVRRAAPRPMPISTSVTSMLKHSADVGKQIDVGAGLASTVGKHWVLDKQLETKPGKACNYGWHFMGPSYQGINGFPAATKEAGTNVRVIQPNATAHDPFHSDYSQICQLVSQLCWLDDVEVRFSDLLKDPTLHFLISHQGPLSIDRQPGVPKTAPVLVLFPIDIIV